MSDILSNNVNLYNAPRWENTAKVIPPGSSSQHGQIVVITGGPAKILTRPLYNASNTVIDTVSVTTEKDRSPACGSSSTLPTRSRLLDLLVSAFRKH